MNSAIRLLAVLLILAPVAAINAASVSVSANQISELRIVDTAFGREWQADLVYGNYASDGQFAVTGSSERFVSDQSSDAHRDEFLAFVEWAQGKTIRDTRQPLTPSEADYFELGETYVVASGDFEGTWRVLSVKGSSPGQVNRSAKKAAKQLAKLQRLVRSKAFSRKMANVADDLEALATAIRALVNASNAGGAPAVRWCALDIKLVEDSVPLAERAARASSPGKRLKNVKRTRSLVRKLGKGCEL